LSDTAGGNPTGAVSPSCWEESMRVLVLGIGSIGRRHARVIHGIGGHELILADTREEFLAELAEELSPRATVTDYRDALKLEPDAAIICTPNSLHADMAVECAQAGCHLLVEKPIAHDLEAADRIVDVAAQCNRAAVVGYVLRFWPGVSEIKQIIDSGRIGAPLGARAMIGAYETLTYARTAWRADGPAEGGPLLDYSHEFDYLRLFLGEVSQVACMAARLGPHAADLVTAAACLLRFGTGALGEVHIDYWQEPARRELDIFGEEGRLRYDFRQMRLTVTDFEGRESEEGWALERDEAFRKQFEAFAAACRGEKTRCVTAQDARGTLAVALAAVESASTGEFVEVA